jgi:hypothetical protein
VLAAHYGFTGEELDFPSMKLRAGIPSAKFRAGDYDMKYRMGREAERRGMMHRAFNGGL